MCDTNTRNVLITGCGNEKGIGYAIAKAYAADNCILTLVDICPYEQISALRKSLIELGAKDVLVIQADVSSDEDVRMMVREVESAIGHIDVLVNNAGVMRISHYLDTDMKDLDLMYRVMVRGTFLCTIEVAKHMIERGIKGKVVNLSSIGGKRPWVYSAGYCACKAAIINLTQTSASVLAKHGINVNAIAPGDHETEMLEQCYREASLIDGISVEDFAQTAKAFIPLGRLGTVDEIAYACHFLTSPSAEYIVGQTINVNGGSFMQ